MLTNTFGFCKPVDLGSSGAQEEEDKGHEPRRCSGSPP